MKIYTRTGDAGETSLLGGKRVSKANLRIEAYGTLDELNCYVGLVRDQAVNEQHRPLLKEIQDRLFTIGSALAADPDKPKLKIPDLHEADITALEDAMDQMDEALPELRHFVLPGGHQAVSFCHLARTVCRRAERHVIRLNEVEDTPEISLRYINRLSDYFFVLSRFMAQALEAEEVKWEPRM